MVRFDVSINSQGKIYLPIEIRQTLNAKHLEIIPDAKAIVVFPKGTAFRDVIRSLEIVRLDLEHRAELQPSGRKYFTRFPDKTCGTQI